MLSAADDGANLMYIVIDCETTGLPRNWKAPAADLYNWPRLVQIAWSRIDSEFRIIEEAAFLVRPEGFTIPSEAQRVHRISTERALLEGKPLPKALSQFGEAVRLSDVVVAHNLRFDENVISAEYLRLNLTPPFENKKRICTMLGTTELCRIPGNYGYKWPSLAELHRTLFGTEFEEAHDAGADVSACANCFVELRRKGLI
jgi:DNA polymerase-3 subunit epsilon